MNKKLKSNKIITILLIIMCLIILFNPINYAKACLNAISVWSLNVLPLLFPFFVLTRLVVSLNQPKNNLLEKFFNKAYHVPTGSFNIFFLSLLSGYPMGAKLICTMYENGQASSQEAEKMLSFCSICGPMFILGTVGAIMLKSHVAGIIILIANILSCLLNGFIYRGKPSLQNKPIYVKKEEKSISLAECVFDSLISILMVGAYIILSFLMIEILSSLHVFKFLTRVICCVFKLNNNQDVVASILKGFIEMTSGILNLSSLNTTLCIKTIITCFLISFGGLNVFLQSLSFLSKLRISPRKMILQKLTQSIWALILTIPLALIFL